MKNLILSVCVSFLIGHLSYSQTAFSRKLDPEKFEGDKPYTPTRIEWLMAEYRNECGLWFGGIPTLSWSLYSGLKEKNKINIAVRFDDESVRSKAQDAAETCARNIKALAKDRGWNWLSTNIELGNRDASKNPALKKADK